MPYKTIDVSSLVEKCITKDPLAWAEFVKRFSSLIDLSIKKTIYKYSSRPHIAENDIADIRQNIMTLLWSRNKLVEIKDRERIDYWLAITARNATVNYLKIKRKEILISDESYFEKLASPEIPEDVSVGQAESKRRLKEIYSVLSSKEKLMFKLYFQRGLSLKDASKIMQLPLGTLSSAITRMKKKIKCSKT